MAQPDKHEDGTPRSAPITTSRITSLDGLRGVAALIVLVSHAVDAASPWYVPGNAEPSWSARWWIDETPLHILWAGPEMVVVFFVLSGYVLVRPAVNRGPAWFSASYYPRRIIRLYLPALAALLLAGLLHEVPAHRTVIGAGYWLNSFAAPVTLAHGLQAATLTSSAAQLTAFTTVLWSMRWEVLFSALLPAAVLLPHLARNKPTVSFAAAVICLVLAAWTDSGARWTDAPHYLAIFELGAFMGFQSRRGPRITRDARLRTILATTLCIFLLTACYWTLHLDMSSATGVPELAAILGAAMAVWLAARSELVRDVLSSRSCRWLGTRSYSLYLVHQPIVISLAFALGGKPDLLLLLSISVPASLVATDLFWRLVERPAISLSRRAGQLPQPRFKAIPRQATT